MISRRAPDIACLKPLTGVAKTAVRRLLSSSIGSSDSQISFSILSIGAAIMRNCLCHVTKGRETCYCAAHLHTRLRNCQTVMKKEE